MMKSNDHFFQSVCALAIPVALQSMLQSSFSMVDQIMIGQLGEIQVAGVGLAGKFASIYAVLISAIGAAAGIMISQYLGQENNRGVRQSFFANLLLSGGILRSGGQTKYVMFIDGIGTWCCGVPLGLLSAFVLRLPVAWVYFLLSLEECLRFGFSMAVFRRKKWMRRLDAGAQPSGLP